MEKTPSALLTIHETDKNGILDAIYQGPNKSLLSKRSAHAWDSLSLNHSNNTNPNNDANDLSQDTVITTASSNATSSGTATATANTIAASLALPTHFVQNLINVFLPTGFPYSVSPDYIGYQWYDSIQAFCSSIASLFANRAALSAVGVGDKEATSTSALFMKIVQETVGRLGTILFAWKLGSALEPECKKYRYMADLVNDSAMVFDCLSPMFPGNRSTRVVLLCMSGLLRSICGVLAGGSRAALTQHFTDPLRGSIADVSAKDQSQETVITLMGMLVGSVVVKYVEGDGLHMWLTVLVLLALHLYTNYRAVSCVVMRTLNRQRTNIVFSDIIRALPEFQGILERVGSNTSDKHDTEPESDDDRSKRALARLVLPPRLVSLKERILERDGALRWYNNDYGLLIGHAEFCSFTALLETVPASMSIQPIFDAADTPNSGYAIFFSTAFDIKICLTTACAESTQLKAWVHALLVARWLYTSAPPTNSNFDPIHLISDTRQLLAQVFDGLQIEDVLPYAGWTKGRYAITSQPLRTITIVQREL